MKNIAFICLGNICRSPLAEGLARAAAVAAGLDVRFDSAGTGNWHVGRPPDPRAVAVAARHGVDIARLRARQVRPEDFQRFDLLLCADRDNLGALARLRPRDAVAEVGLLLDWAGVEAGGEVPDPYYGDDEEFLAVFDLLSRAARALIERIAEDSAATGRR